MLKIRYHKQFKKDFKLAMKRGLKAELLEEVLNFLVQEKEHRIFKEFVNAIPSQIGFWFIK